jgi:hypothetical protein
VTATVVGTTKKHHLDGMIKTVDLEITSEEIESLGECYFPHPLVGVMAHNTPDMANSKQVWSPCSDILKTGSVMEYITLNNGVGIPTKDSVFFKYLI